MIAEGGSTLRFAKLLHILPKLTVSAFCVVVAQWSIQYLQLLARELVEHIRVGYTFQNDQSTVKPAFLSLFGDIFAEEREGMSSCQVKTER